MAAISPLKLSMARGVGTLSRGLGRGGGTSLPGKLLLRLQPDSIERLAAGLANGSIVISATNGKTTTAALLASILRRSGMTPVHNHSGANMPGGVATALLDAARDDSHGDEIGIFEVDEAWAAELVVALRPRVVLLANLFRDQLDRYGELETLADSWEAMIAALPESTVVVLNADDPLLAMLAPERANVVYFGIEDTGHVEATTRHAADSTFCRRCGAPLVYAAVQLGHLGTYSCQQCGLQRPPPDVAATKIAMRGMDGSSVVIRTPAGTVTADLPIPGLYNVYNAVAAAAAAHALELTPGAIAGGLAAARAVFGRVETVEVNGHAVAILLIKNPTGANEVVRTITTGLHQFDLWIALNDKTADGHDVSWIWDVDFERLADRARLVTCSGTRAEEIALRLAYAGIPRELIRVDDRIEASFDDAVLAAISAAMPLYALPTYTSLLELRTAIARRGDAPSYWQP